MYADELLKPWFESPFSGALTTLRCGIADVVSPQQMQWTLGRQSGDLGNARTVTRHACKVSEPHRYAHVFRSVVTLLDLYETHADRLATNNPYGGGWDLIAAAALVARTPDVRLPDV